MMCVCGTNDGREGGMMGHMDGWMDDQKPAGEGKIVHLQLIILISFLLVGGKERKKNKRKVRLSCEAS